MREFSFEEGDIERGRAKEERRVAKDIFFIYIIVLFHQ